MNVTGMLCQACGAGRGLCGCVIHLALKTDGTRVDFACGKAITEYPRADEQFRFQADKATCPACRG